MATETEKFLAAIGETNTVTEPSPGIGQSETDKFLAAIGEPSTPTSLTRDSAPRVMLPAATATISEIQERLTPEQVASEFGQRQLDEENAYIQRNVQPGVPLDVRSGLGMIERIRVGMTRGKMNQLDVLRNMYGKDSIRLDDEGNFIVRQVKDGKATDILVDENKMTLSDLADVSSEVLPMIASILTTKGVPVKEVFRSALRGAAGYGGTATVQDTVMSLAEGQSPDMKEILTERGTGALSDTIFGYGFGKGLHAVGTIPKLARLASSSLADTPKEAAMSSIEEGRKAVEKRFNVKMEPTVAELTGNPMALRLEAFLSNIPIARNQILKKWQKALDNEKAVQNAWFGGQAPDSQRVGEELIGILGGEMKRSEEIAGKAASIVRREGQEAITEPLESISGRPLSNFQFGSRMIKRGEAQLESFKKTAAEKFNAVRVQPDIGNLVFDATPIKARAAAIRNELVKEASGDVAKPLAPSGLNAILESIDKLPDQQSYFDLKDLRESIYDRIDSPEPISSKGSRLLKKLGGEITDQMQAQGKANLSPQTMALIKDANKFYADNVETFYQKGILDMLKPRTEAGAVNPELVASRLVAGGKGSVTTYNTFKSFFEKSGAVKDMNRLLRDRIIEAGTDTATGLVKVEDLAAAAAKMEPEIVKELFGKTKDELLEAYRVGQIAKSGMSVRVPGEQSGVVAEEFQKLANEGKLSGPAIRTLVQRTLDLRKQYGNSIRKAVKENDLGVIEAAPENFTKEYLFNPKTPIADVRDAMQSVYRSGNTELVEDVRRAFLGDLFNDVAKRNKGDIVQLVEQVKGSPLRDLDPQAFAIKLQDQAFRKRAEEILGPEEFKNLQSYALSIGSRTMRDAAGSLTGAFAGGSMFERMLSGLGGLSEVPKYMALSWLVTSPRTVSMMRNAEKLAPADMGKAIRAAVLTPEFQRVISEDAKDPEEAHQVAVELKRWAESATQ